MGKYTDDEIRAMPKITIKIAADYLGISQYPNFRHEKQCASNWICNQE